MPAITLLPTLYYFFLTNFFFFLSFLLPFLSFSYSLVGLLCSLLLFSHVVPFFLLFSLYTADGPFILPTVKSIYYFTLNCFCLGVGVLPDHPLVCQLLSHHHFPVLAVPHPITRQRVLFCLLAHCVILTQIRVDTLSYYPS